MALSGMHQLNRVIVSSSLSNVSAFKETKVFRYKFEEKDTYMFNNSECKVRL